MELLEAIGHIVSNKIDAAGIKHLVVGDLRAAQVMSQLVNSEGALGYITGPFDEYAKLSDADADDEVWVVSAYYVDLRTSTE